MAECDIPKTTFVTHRSLYEWARLPFSFKNAPAIFQRAMQYVLGDALGVHALVYLDDIVIFSESVSDHRRHVEDIFRKLKQFGLVIKESKCRFHDTQLPLIWHPGRPEEDRSD